MGGGGRDATRDVLKTSVGTIHFGAVTPNKKISVYPANCSDISPNPITYLQSAGQRGSSMQPCEGTPDSPGTYRHIISDPCVPMMGNNAKCVLYWATKQIRL